GSRTKSARSARSVTRCWSDSRHAASAWSKSAPNADAATTARPLLPRRRANAHVSMPVDRVIDGQYRLDRLLGRGGMGAVDEGEDLSLRRTVAIKVLLSRFFGERDALRRFEREARLGARLNHPSIVTIFGYGTLPAAGAYLVMERLVGVTLRDEL